MNEPTEQMKAVSEEFQKVAQPLLNGLTIFLKEVREEAEIKDLPTYSPLRSVEHTVGGILNAMGMVFFLNSNLRMAEQSLKYYMEERIDEKQIEKNIEEGNLSAKFNPYPLLRELKSQLEAKIADHPEIYTP